MRPCGTVPRAERRRGRRGSCRVQAGKKQGRGCGPRPALRAGFLPGRDVQSAGGGRSAVLSPGTPQDDRGYRRSFEGEDTAARRADTAAAICGDDTSRRV